MAHMENFNSTAQSIFWAERVLAMNMMKIDIGKMTDKGYRPGQTMAGILSFNGNDMAVCVLNSKCMSLFYQQQNGFFSKYVNKEIPIVRLPHNDESESAYFLCKCGKKTRGLYHKKASLVCRKCSNLTSRTKYAQYEFIPFKGE